MKKDRRQHAAPSGGKWKSLLQRCGGERVFVAAFLVLALATGFLGTILLPKQEFSENENRMLETLDAVDVETRTPIEALNFLYELKKTLKGSLNG